MKVRYSFIILATLSVLTAFVAVMISLKAISDSQHKWCQVVSTITAIPVPKPEHPETDQSRERAWEFYNEFVDLKRSLGC